MAKNPPDESLVYLALKNVFKGPKAKLRTLNKIRKLIQKYLDNGDAEVRALVAEHDIDNICNTVKALLQDEIFKSTLKAKIRFPEVFDVSAVQSAERVASEAKAARSDADAIREAAEGNQGTWAVQEADKAEVSYKGKGKEPESQLSPTRSQKRSSRTSVSVRSLYPVYLPLRTQHQLLVKVQTILENACYSFARKMMGEVLQKKRWDCPESVELNTWAGIFRHNEDIFNAEKLLELGKPFSELLESIAQLRHTAVHRVRVSATKAYEFITEAESLANLLHEDSSAQMLSCLRRETKQVIDELGSNKDLLEALLNERLQEIDAQRRELDKLERKAVDEMLEEDKEYQTLASAILEQFISAPETMQHSTSTPEHDIGSETEVEAESS